MVRIEAKVLARELSSTLLSMVNAEDGYIEFEGVEDGADTLADIMYDYFYQLYEEEEEDDIQTI